MARTRKNTETAPTEENPVNDFQADNSVPVEGPEAPETQVTEGTDPTIDNAGNPEAPEGAEAKTRRSAPVHIFNPGDVATVVRGKFRQQKFTILKYSEAKGQYTGELEDGGFTVLNATNLKPPTDSTVSVAAVVDVVAKLQQDPETADFAQRLALAMDEIVPEFSVKLNEATAEQTTTD